MAHGDLVQVGGQRLSGVLDGDRFRITRLSGWWETPGVKKSLLVRESADGDFFTPWHFDSRIIGVDGLVEACSHDRVHELMNRLSGLASYRREFFRVGGHGRTQEALVEAGDPGHYFFPVTDKIFRFELRFRASDPRKLGHEHSEDIGITPVSVTHAGNHRSWPIIEVTPTAGVLGPNGFTVEFAYADGSTKEWWFQYPASTTHRIDMYRGTQTVSGNPQLSVRRADQCFVPPGEEVSVRVYPTGMPSTSSVQGKMWWRDTWI